MNRSMLRQALAETADRVRKERRHRRQTRFMQDVNEATHKVFRSRIPVLRVRNWRLQNVSAQSLKRVERLFSQKRVNYKGFTMRGLLDWLYEHWDEILRVLISIVGIIIMFI